MIQQEIIMKIYFCQFFSPPIRPLHAPTTGFQKAAKDEQLTLDRVPPRSSAQQMLLCAPPAHLRQSSSTFLCSTDVAVCTPCSWNLATKNILKS